MSELSQTKNRSTSCLNIYACFGRRLGLIFLYASLALFLTGFDSEHKKNPFPRVWVPAGFELTHADELTASYYNPIEKISLVISKLEPLTEDDFKERLKDKDFIRHMIDMAIEAKTLMEGAVSQVKPISDITALRLNGYVLLKNRPAPFSTRCIVFVKNDFMYNLSVTASEKNILHADAIFEGVIKTI